MQAKTLARPDLSKLKLYRPVATGAVGRRLFGNKVVILPEFPIPDALRELLELLPTEAEVPRLPPFNVDAQLALLGQDSAAPVALVPVPMVEAFYGMMWAPAQPSGTTAPSATEASRRRGRLDDDEDEPDERRPSRWNAAASGASASGGSGRDRDRDRDRDWGGDRGSRR